MITPPLAGSLTPAAAAAKPIIHTVAWALAHKYPWWWIAKMLAIGACVW